MDLERIVITGPTSKLLAAAEALHIVPLLQRRVEVETSLSKCFRRGGKRRGMSPFY